MKQRTILLADDNLQDALLTLRALRHLYVLNTIDIVRYCWEALVYFFYRKKYAERDPTARPAFVLLHNKPPKPSGFEVPKLLSTERKTQVLPVIIQTASDKETDLIACYKLGVNSFLNKSLDFVEFS